MSVIKKGGEGDDTPEVTKQEQEKSDALSRMHAAAKIAFRAPEWHARKAKEKIRVRCGVRKTGSCDGWFPGRNVHNRGKVPTAHRFA